MVREDTFRKLGWSVILGAMLEALVVAALHMEEIQKSDATHFEGYTLTLVRSSLSRPKRLPPPGAQTVNWCRKSDNALYEECGYQTYAFCKLGLGLIEYSMVKDGTWAGCYERPE